MFIVWIIKHFVEAGPSRRHYRPPPLPLSLYPWFDLILSPPTRSYLRAIFFVSHGLDRFQVVVVGLPQGRGYRSGLVSVSRPRVTQA